MMPVHYTVLTVTDSLIPYLYHMVHVPKGMYVRKNVLINQLVVIDNIILGRWYTAMSGLMC